ncbi:helix-turn-helix transcriptional regulator [Labilibaculum manganireducens]|uniref:helix-turn-helix domain-containing protein n=1 Tax=Labilibaculum manganireducens TaxID=1940525 RepID=UPI0029F4F950|nr:helix-turn-helix transcriptional regulator [Labilibaculum manganireducens]
MENIEEKRILTRLEVQLKQVNQNDSEKHIPVDINNDTAKLKGLYYDIFGDVIENYEKTKPDSLVKNALNIFKEAAYHLKAYIENPNEKEITWNNPTVMLQYNIDYTYSKESKSSFFTHFGADKERNYSEKIAERLIGNLGEIEKIYTLKRLSNDLAFLMVKEDVGNLLLPLEISEKFQNQSIDTQEKTIQELLDIKIFTININGTKPGKSVDNKDQPTGRISFQVQPLIIEKKSAYYPIFVKLEIDQTNTKKWNNEEKQRFWNEIFKYFDQINPEEKLPVKWVENVFQDKTILKSDCPKLIPNYIVSSGDQLYFNFRNSIATRSFKPPQKEEKWHKAILDSKNKRLRAIAELIPVGWQDKQYIPEKQLEELQKRMAENREKMDDLTADVLDAITYVWLQEARNKKKSVFITADDILKLRGIKPQKSGSGRRGGYQKKQRDEIACNMNILDNTWITVLEREVFEEEETKKGYKRNRRKKKRGLQSRAILISERIGQLTIDGNIEADGWEVELGNVLKAFLSGQGRQIALLSIKALQYDPYRQDWEKRLCRYLSWQWKIKRSQENCRQPYKVSTLLNETKKEVNTRNPGRIKDRFENALDTLQRDNIISNWYYDPQMFDENIIGKRGWWKKWLEWLIYIEPPKEIIEKYQKIHTPQKRNFLPSPTKSSKVKSKKANETDVLDIRRIRKEQDLTLEMVSEELGISVTYLSLIENGKRKPGKKVLKRIEQWKEQKCPIEN